MQCGSGFLCGIVHKVVLCASCVVRAGFHGASRHAEVAWPMQLTAESFADPENPESALERAPHARVRTTIFPPSFRLACLSLHMFPHRHSRMHFLSCAVCSSLGGCHALTIMSGSSKAMCYRVHYSHVHLAPLFVQAVIWMIHMVYYLLD